MTKELRRDGLEQVQILYKALRCEIERGDLEPGRVVTYSEICARIAGDPGRFPWNGYSVVACALWLLRREGLVETRPRLGTRIIVEGETWAVAGRDASEPLAVHIERVMRHRLADQVYPPNTRIPTLHLLAEEFGVSVKTVRNGLEALFEEGLLLATHPGTYVTARTGQVPREKLLCLAERPAARRGMEYVAWGEPKTLADWVRDPRCVVPYRCLKARFLEHKWPLKRAMTTPIPHAGRNPGQARESPTQD
ncbi:GntR family transcriptional regulator [Streptomyces kanamyceticus]|uniref:GntR family transcriptional regulator n=1 Tax=Streptomyces kanamyceticus TaxID=1967 RepID=UPI0037DD7986